ncbi:hypothetical protein [Sinanaerobacter sp. ZZT-01]|uniref:hypothetical protein n=1 Tax=Sinanaerobacter sp. ZZT-01 TaxID=3111540 RepID=UPI002D784430|nr:hypothetical protein [Sinanaerobacter sp. ZZT-01]WRR92373.1 hypothetical protein U5921_09890 [Sinanaerobacter sp. ZZT-01]
MKKKTVVFSLLLIFALIILGGALFLRYAFSPTADDKRNLSFGDAELSVEIVNGSFVKPIIRTYELEEYQSFSEAKREKIQNQTLGKIEGDIPCVYLDGTKESLKFSFKKDGVKTKPDHDPEIQLTSYPVTTEDQEPERVITGSLLKDEKDEYFYMLYRYRTQYEKYFLETNCLQLSYEIDGRKYISIFSVHTSNPDADFFNNETLKEPIPPEKLY